MTIELQRLLQQASDAHRTLRFVVVLPAWEDADALITLKRSKFLTQDFVLRKKDHEHLERYSLTPEKDSIVPKTIHPQNTHFYFLESNHARGGHPVSESIIRNAFQC
jgi:hypothetical protein